MVFVKVRETYDLKTTQNKMTLISIHTPRPGIIKQNYPGLLMQCRAYRPVSADVRLACASVLPLDPLGVGTEAGDVAPEDVFNPILYSAMSNKGMSQLEARIQALSYGYAGADIVGNNATVDVDDFISGDDDFNIYYGLLSEVNNWKHANPQQGLELRGLKPLVYELVYNIGDSCKEEAGSSYVGSTFHLPAADGTLATTNYSKIIGKAKEMPFINCTEYSPGLSGGVRPGFGDEETKARGLPWNAEQNVPFIHVVCGAIIVPPSRLHSLYFRMVVEWTIEFSSIRPLGEITNWSGLSLLGQDTHYQNYSYDATKKAVTGDDSTILNNDSTMVSSNADIKKVM